MLDDDDDGEDPGYSGLLRANMLGFAKKVMYELIVGDPDDKVPPVFQGLGIFSTPREAQTPILLVDPNTDEVYRTAIKQRA